LYFATNERHRFVAALAERGSAKRAAIERAKDGLG
jgi:hypothetical protein